MTLELNNPLGYFLVMAGLAAFSLLLLRVSPYYAQLVDKGGGRFAALDGLRGLLATGVFVHHAAVHYVFAQTGRWEKPESRLYEFLGGDSVNVFFMITGFLFWRKCISGGGKIDVVPFLRGRVRRIMPAYLLATAAIALIAFALAGFALKEPIGEVAIELLRWSFGGLLGNPYINGVNTLPINSGVTWTLQYEWAFYLTLPLIAFFATHKRMPILCGLIAVLVVVFRVLHIELPFSPGSVARFLMGMLVAHAVVRYPKSELLASRWLGGLLSLLLCAYMAFPLPRALLGFTLWALFAAVIYGNDLFGLLTARWTTLLGHLSYSIYLIHGIVLFASLRAYDAVASITALSPLAYWGFITLVGGALIVVTAGSYRIAEAPFLGEKSADSKRHAFQPLAQQTQPAVAPK